MTRGKSIALVLCAGMLSAACGSTVAQSGTSTVGAGAPVSSGTDGLGGVGAPATNGSIGGASAPGGTGGLASGTSGSGTATSAGATAPVGGGAPTSDAGAGGATSTGQDGLGVTGTSVAIGLGYTVNADQAQQALGSSFSTGDQRAEYDAIIADINKNGGIRGRKLLPVYHKDDATSTETKDAKDQARCAFFTQDNKVFAVLDSAPSDNFLACIQRSSMNIAGFETTGYNEVDFTKHRYFFDVNTLTGEKSYGSLPASLSRQGWFSGWNATTGAPAAGTKDVVGLLSVDYPQITAVTDKVLLPTLARIGHPVKPENVVRLHNPNSSAEIGQTVSEIQNAVLRFRSNGVTHVIIMDNAGGVTFFFANDADGQKYYPRYGVTSANSIQGLVESGQMSKAQANGAMGLGYVPFLDIPAAANPDTGGPYTNATRRRCLKVMSSNGISFPDQNSKAIAIGYCDKLYFFAQVASAVSGPLNRDTFAAAVNALGTSYSSGALQVTRFDAAHHYGITRGYDMRYDGTCSCMRYLGSPISLG